MSGEFNAEFVIKLYTKDKDGFYHSQDFDWEITEADVSALDTLPNFVKSVVDIAKSFSTYYADYSEEDEQKGSECDGDIPS